MAQLAFDADAREHAAIELLRSLCPAEGYYVAFSGGKDSVVVLDLVRRSGVKYDAHHNITTTEPPEHVLWMRAHFAEVSHDHPGTTMWRLIEQKMWPPTRHARYCCYELKEKYGNGRVVLTGVRWQESANRRKRRMVEGCNSGGNKTFLHPIIDWSEQEVWAYHERYGLPHSPLYDEGFTRVGCVMCPLKGHKGMQRDEERWPKIAGAYRRAMARCFEHRASAGLPQRFASGDEMYDWWAGRVKGTRDAVELYECENCGATIERKQGKGRKPRFCGDSCRQAAHRARKR